MFNRKNCITLCHTDRDVEEANCSDGEIRLRDHIDSVRDGRVEMCLSRVWGTVCSNQFSDADAEVVCSQIDFDRIGMCW